MLSDYEAVAHDAGRCDPWSCAACILDREVRAGETTDDMAARLEMEGEG